MRGEVRVYLERLKQEQAGCLELLARPRSKTEFGFGEASGILQGLNRAEKLLEQVMEEEEDDAASE